MPIKSIYAKYFQKSKMFLYPLLGIKKGVDIVPSETYITWGNSIKPEDMKLICLYHPIEKKGFNDLKIALKPLATEIIGITPEINDPFLHYPRTAEVELYLEQNNLHHILWFAIDDTPAFYRPGSPVVYTDVREGFTTNDCAKVHELIKTLR